MCAALSRLLIHEFVVQSLLTTIQLYLNKLLFAVWLIM